MKRLRKLLLVAAAFFTFAAAEAETLHGRIVKWSSTFSEGWSNWDTAIVSDDCNIPCYIMWEKGDYEIKFVAPNYKTVRGYQISDPYTDKIRGYDLFVLKGEDDKGQTALVSFYIYWSDPTKIVISVDYYMYRFMYQIYIPPR